METNTPPARPLRPLARLYVRVLQGVPLFFSTWRARILYAPFLKMGPGCKIHKGVEINQVLPRESRLCVTLE